MPSYFQSVTPSLTVTDIAAAITFYEAVLGFDCLFKNGSPTCFALLRRESVEIGLRTQVLGGVPGRHNCYIKLNGIESLYEEVRKKEVPILHPLRTEEYGMKEFMIADPDGNTINFGEIVTPSD